MCKCPKLPHPKFMSITSTLCLVARAFRHYSLLSRHEETHLTTKLVNYENVVQSEIKQQRDNFYLQYGLV